MKPLTNILGSFFASCRCGNDVYIPMGIITGINENQIARQQCKKCKEYVNITKKKGELYTIEEGK